MNNNGDKEWERKRERHKYFTSAFVDKDISNILACRDNYLNKTKTVSFCFSLSSKCHRITWRCMMQHNDRIFRVNKPCHVKLHPCPTWSSINSNQSLTGVYSCMYWQIGVTSHQPFRCEFDLSWCLKIYLHCKTQQQIQRFLIFIYTFICLYTLYSFKKKRWYITLCMPTEECVSKERTKQGKKSRGMWRTDRYRHP